MRWNTWEAALWYIVIQIEGDINAEKTLLALPVALALAGVATAASQGKLPEDVLDELIKQTNSTYLTQSPQNIMMMPDNPAWEVAEAGKSCSNSRVARRTSRWRNAILARARASSQARMPSCRVTSPMPAKLWISILV